MEAVEPRNRILGQDVRHSQEDRIEEVHAATFACVEIVLQGPETAKAFNFE